MIGYISQDDLLIEELTVYQNLFLNAKLCFDGLSDEAIRERVDGTLISLGLYEIKDIQVGNPMNKKNQWRSTKATELWTRIDPRAVRIVR